MTGDYTAGETRPEEIREEIEQTRLEMGETIDAIQERLSPDHMKEQAMGAVLAATIGRAEEAVDGATQTVKGAGTRMIDTIKQNPIPAAMIGIGVGWLVMQNRGSSSYGQTSGQGQQRLRDVASTGRQQAEQTVGQVQHQAEQTIGQVQHQAEQIVGQAQYQAEHAVGQLQDTAGRVTERTQGQLKQLMQENPLALGGVALALGVAAGLALPETQKEHELMGEAHDRVIDQVKTQVEETQQKVQRVAEEAQKAATEEAKKQELAPQ